MGPGMWAPEDPSEMLVKGLLIPQTDVKMRAASLEDRGSSDRGCLCATRTLDWVTVPEARAGCRGPRWLPRCRVLPHQSVSRTEPESRCTTCHRCTAEPVFTLGLSDSEQVLLWLLGTTRKVNVKVSPSYLTLYNPIAIQSMEFSRPDFWSG